MSRFRPNIGVTGPDEGGTAAWWFTWFAVTLQGGRAIRIYPKKGIPDEEIHGLILGGGADIHPQRYGESMMEELFSNEREVSSLRQFFQRLATIFFFPIIYLIRKLFSTAVPGIDSDRDELEFDLLRRSMEKGIPVLGICRGAQLINIHFGGTLHQDIKNYYTEVPRINSVWPKKKVRLDQESKLFDILQLDYAWVNAMHHQAVDRLGEELSIVAREETGIVQAIEHENNDFVLGVQWHPEYMPQIPPQRRLFNTLVEQAREYKDRDPVT